MAHRIILKLAGGEVLEYYFDEQKVQIENRARGGRSSRSYYNEVGLWDSVVDEIGSEDFVLIQFGHNDRDTKPERYTSPEDFEGYLTKYVDEIIANGAVPILVSPMVMNAYSGDVLRNVFTESGNDYRGSMAKVASELDVAFVDLNMMSYDLVNSLGVEQASHYLYLILDSGEYENYPDGSDDGTHFQEFGAIEMSRLIVEGIEELSARNDIQSLLPLIKQRYALTVENVGANDSIITKNNAYPKDTPLTLKTIPGTDDSFNAWYRLGALIEDETILQIAMPSRNLKVAAAFNGEVPLVVPTAFLIGDSTVANYAESYYPQTGWGQVLQPFFDSTKISVDNAALGGRSSKSFYNDHWNDVKAGIVEGDFVFIQFGINDRAFDDPDRSARTGGVFEGYMTSFANETIALGATPVFVSTVRRNQWNDGSPYDAYHEHPGAVRTLAADLDVALIDLDEKIRRCWSLLERTTLTAFIIWVSPQVNMPTSRMAGLTPCIFKRPVL
jgi:Lysophospholipase L1 and related esterases